MKSYMDYEEAKEYLNDNETRRITKSIYEKNFRLYCERPLDDEEEFHEQNGIKFAEDNPELWQSYCEQFGSNSAYSEFHKYLNSVGPYESCCGFVFKVIYPYYVLYAIDPDLIPMSQSDYEETTTYHVIRVGHDVFDKQSYVCEDIIDKRAKYYYENLDSGYTLYLVDDEVFDTIKKWIKLGYDGYGCININPIYHKLTWSKEEINNDSNWEENCRYYD